jgi:hypothetical protein
MCLAAVHHAEMATQLSALWAAVSLATQSVLGHLPVDTPQAGIVGEIVVQFQERADQCSCLEAIGQEICDNVLGPTGDLNYLVACLEEVTERLSAT